MLQRELAEQAALLKVPLTCHHPLAIMARVKVRLLTRAVRQSRYQQQIDDLARRLREALAAKEVNHPTQTTKVIKRGDRVTEKLKRSMLMS